MKRYYFDVREGNAFEVEDPEGSAVMFADVAPAFDWLANGKTGTSSVTMLMCHLGLPCDRAMPPGDCNDLERCILMVQQVPGVRGSFGAIAAMGPVWEAVVKAWDGLELLYGKHGNNQEMSNPYVAAAQEVIASAR